MPAFTAAVIGARVWAAVQVDTSGGEVFFYVLTREDDVLAST
jgi:hypothetical protein